MNAHQANLIERGWWTFQWVGVIAAYVGIVSFLGVVSFLVYTAAQHH